jgi:hypothetical protein
VVNELCRVRAGRGGAAQRAVPDARQCRCQIAAFATKTTVTKPTFVLSRFAEL